jgi:hypothetical protein
MPRLQPSPAAKWTVAVHNVQVMDYQEEDVEEERGERQAGIPKKVGSSRRL